MRREYFNETFKNWLDVWYSAICVDIYQGHQNKAYSYCGQKWYIFSAFDTLIDRIEVGALNLKNSNNNKRNK